MVSLRKLPYLRIPLHLQDLPRLNYLIKALKLSGQSPSRIFPPNFVNVLKALVFLRASHIMGELRSASRLFSVSCLKIDKEGRDDTVLRIWIAGRNVCTTEELKARNERDQNPGDEKGSATRPPERSGVVLTRVTQGPSTRPKRTRRGAWKGVCRRDC